MGEIGRYQKNCYKLSLTACFMFITVRTRKILTRRRVLVIGVFLILGCHLEQLVHFLSGTPATSIDPGDHYQKYKVQSHQILCNGEDVNNNPQESYSTGLTPNRSSPNILLLSSLGRSGSSFLGGILNTIPGVFYYFEPLYNLQQWHILTQPLAVDSLKRLYLCNFTGPVFTALRDNWKNSFRHPFFNSCGRKNSCLKQSRLTKVCRRAPVRMVKTIRTRVSSLWSLLEDPDLDLRVIHIMRDPRASIISNWKAGWNTTAGNLCDNLLLDLQNATHLRQRHPHKYMPLRYEDLCAEPRSLTMKIFQFLGYDHLFPETITFLDKSTSKDDPKGDEYSIKRNTSSQQQKWRRVITQKQLDKVEGVCSASITRLGFNIFTTVQNVRNLKIPLYRGSFINPLFNYSSCLNL